MKLLTKATTTVVLTLGLAVGGTIPSVPKEVQAKARVVYIAPQHGKKYHYKKYCRGLSNANSKRRVTLRWARSHYYRLCGWEK